jgi:putative ABC transport system permease protein
MHRDRRREFLIEAGLLTGTGGAAGVTLGLAVNLVISILTGLPFSLSPVYITLAVMLCGAIGIIFGIFHPFRVEIGRLCDRLRQTNT